MWPIGLMAVVTAIQVYGYAASADPHAIYQRRRQGLRHPLGNGALVLFGATRDSSDLRSGFYQEPNFYYLTGWSEPGAILLLMPGGPREILFLPAHNAEAEMWSGRRHSFDDPDIGVIAGFETVMPVDAFESELRKCLNGYPKLYGLAYTASAGKLQAIAGRREVSDVEPELANLRMRKSAEEVALLQHAIDVTAAAQQAAWKRAIAGTYEYQVAAALVFHFLDQGCERPAYAPTVGSGPNALTLHYSMNSRRLNEGEVAVIDAGAECAGYAADITRSIPVGGHFSARQREIYDIVLGAQNAVIAAVKPGMTIGKTAPHSLYAIAYDYINTHGRDRNGDPLGKYFTHGISHHIGLEVHDASDPAAPLEPGMVISVEPGIYIPEESIGVRIEDMVLVTKDGARVLSAALPRDPAEIEKAVAR